MSSRSIFRIGLNFLVLALFLMHVSTAFHLPFLSTLENISYDVRVRMTMANTPSEDVVIADIDEKSLEALGQWPWSRNVLAELMDVLFDHYQINVIGFDIIFPEEDGSSGLNILEQLSRNELKNNQSYLREYKKLESKLKYDKMFADSLKDRNIVMGHTFDAGQELRVNELAKPGGDFDEEIAKRMHVKHPRGYIANIPLLQNSAKSSAFFDNPSLDEDGVFRRVAVLQEYKGQLYPSLALETARLSMGSPEINFGIRSDQNDGFRIRDFQVGEKSIPLDKNADVLVPFRGPAYIFPYYSIADILEKKIPVDQLKNRIVLLGTSAAGLLDLRATPVAKDYPGVEVHANIISGILSGSLMTLPDYTIGLEVISILFLGLIMVFFQPKLRPSLNILLASGLIVFSVVVNAYFWSIGYVMPITSEVLLIIALFLLHMSYGYIFEYRGKLVMTKQFGQYVPPEIVDEMSANPGELSLEGQTKTLSVLFSDVRGFTTISEGLDAKELADLMNQYLTPMTEVIHHKRGTIDKYIGDAVMAFWGAPLDEPNHARLAIDASMDMLARLDSLNVEFAKRNWPVISIGIGVNTGEMNVGNMGSDFRMSYTVLGDAVNLGARLEGLTKQYGVTMIVSEYTADAVTDYSYLELDRVKVKGKLEPVTIYQPLCLTEDLSSEQKANLHQYAEAMTSYRKQNWANAKLLLTELQSKDIDRLIYEIYLERIEFFEKEPPGKDWDGVFVHTSK